MTRRSKVIVALLAVLIGIPAAAVLLVSLSFHILNRTNGTLVSSGEKREYLLYVPATYDRARPAPLVISLHGAMLWPALQMRISQWNRLADEQRLIVVYPSGTRLAPFPFLPALPVWRTSSRTGLMADVRFISDLIDTLERRYNIDPDRIYVNGFSNGGAMALTLSCTLSDRIAAVGTVSAASVPWSWCTERRPLPTIAFHGTADYIVLNDGASPAALRNRCGPNPIASAVAADVTRLEYTGCADGAPVVRYTVRGGGHSWPGGRPLPEWLVGPTTRSIDATRLMWTFFQGRRSSR